MASSAYVETAEPPEGEFWEPWYYAMCGDCDWQGNGYSLGDYPRARREAITHECGPEEDADA